MAKKTWAQKMATPAEPEVSVMDKAGMGIPAGAKMLITTPRRIEQALKAIPPGQFRKPEEVRAELARESGADATCPLTFGIFLRIVAENACDELEHGAKPEEIAPFWRVADVKSTVAKKLRLGAEFIAQHRAAEGLPERN